MPQQNILQDQWEIKNVNGKCFLDWIACMSESQTNLKRKLPFQRTTPNKTFSFNNKKCFGGKLSKEIRNSGRGGRVMKNSTPSRSQLKKFAENIIDVPTPNLQANYNMWIKV